TGDNGAFMGEHGLADKWYLYEESVRVPMIVHDPRLRGERRGSVPEQQVLNIDIAPTLLDYAGVRRPRSMQGHSLRPLVEGRRSRWRTDWYYEHRFRNPLIPASEGVRNQQWSYWRFLDFPDVGEFLFDHRADPFQVSNRAADPAARPVLETLRARTEHYSRTLL
ncbi:MAG: sulfatase/phosphatase domain-containing protein, partial [Armatimonadaceae bacterium]